MDSKPYTREQLVWLVPYSPEKTKVRGMKKEKIMATDRYQSAGTTYSVVFTYRHLTIQAENLIEKNLTLEII